jgi:hypothetical protein
VTAAKRYDVIILGAGIAGSYAAMRLTAEGKSVALVEKGLAAPLAADKATPPIIFTERTNEGVVEARNHVVGGNSAYWGGGLVRQREGELAAMLLQNHTGEDRLIKHYAEAERAAGLPSPTRRYTVKMGDGKLDICEFFVLPGRRRNLARRFLKKASATRRMDLYSSCQPEALGRGADGSISSVTIGDGLGQRRTLTGKSVILSMGVVDSILFAERFKEELNVAKAAPLGRKLHDHLSIPLFEVEARPGSSFYKELAPTFNGPFVVGRRIEIQDEQTEWRAAGFLHFQCIFDEAEPYHTIKGLMDLRQRGFRLLEATRMLPACIGSLPAIMKIGFYKTFLGRLYISPKVRVVATLDFESFPNPGNSITLMRGKNETETAEMQWDVRERDIESFSHLYERVRAILDALSRHYGLEIKPVPELKSDISPEQYFSRKAKDAYHLGGGLQSGTVAEESLCGPELKWHGVPNLYVLTTGAFRRAGSANPVLTLLAMADWLADRL